MKSQEICYENQNITKKIQSEIFNYAQEKVIAFGFSRFFFRTLLRLGNTHLDGITISNYPNEFITKYENSHYPHKDPLISHCQLSIEPFRWDEHVFNQAPDLRKHMQSIGLKYGWAQSVHDARGAVSILSIGRSQPSLTEDEFNEKTAGILWLCNQLHSIMISQFSPVRHAPHSVSRLSTREVEVLKWTAEGKTASDIAMILSLTTRTVNFHISSAMQKMGASNKTSAVVIATKSGLL